MLETIQILGKYIGERTEALKNTPITSEAHSLQLIGRLDELDELIAFAQGLCEECKSLIIMDKDVE